MSDGADPSGFGVVAIYGAATRRGLVAVTLDERTETVTPSKAREMATMLLEAASAAEGDEIVVGLLSSTGYDERRIATVLLALRRRRADLERRARAEARRQLAEDAIDADLPD